mgnify:CR=1 FL=1
MLYFYFNVSIAFKTCVIESFDDGRVGVSLSRVLADQSDRHELGDIVRLFGQISPLLHVRVFDERPIDARQTHVLQNLAHAKAINEPGAQIVIIQNDWHLKYVVDVGQTNHLLFVDMREHGYLLFGRLGHRRRRATNKLRKSKSN